MALAKAYCTVAQVLADIRNAAAPTAEVESAIVAASRWIDGYRGRDYLFHDHSASPLEIWGGDPGLSEGELIVPFDPILTLTAVNVDGVPWVLGTDYRVDGAFRLIPLAGWFPVARTSVVKLTGTFGYIETPAASGVFAVPDNVNRAAVMLAGTLSGYQRKDVVALDGNITTVADRNVPPQVFTLLGCRVVRT
jgi:hypothetical protein